MRRFAAMPRSQDGEIPASERKSDGRTRYGAPWVSAASALPLNTKESPPRRVARLTAAAVRRPLRLAALISLVIRTPRAYVVLSGSAAGQALEGYFNRRWGVVPMRQFCRGVLVLPPDHADYLRGRRRQALRTNLRRAAQAGIRCEVVTDPQQAVDDIPRVWRRQWGSLPETVFQARLTDVLGAISRSELTIAVARDEHGRPLAMAALIVDDMVCLLRDAVATSHEARWALHDHIVRRLIARRVRYLLATGGGPFGALGFAPNLQHYQHLLGYELRHVIPVTESRVKRSRGLQASLFLTPPETSSGRAFRED